MSSIVIGFGGTGAKMIQSFVMMAASGALKLSRPVKILLVDQDRGNGNTQRAVETIETYRKIYEMLAGVDDPVRPFNVKLEVYSDIVWQPLAEADTTLANFFRHSDGQGPDNLSSRLLEVLFTREELIDTTLDKGFRGHPNIGAPVFADTVCFEDEPWKSLYEDIEHGINSNSNATIVLCGSIFGGTGAAGIPNICKILKERIKKPKDGKPKRSQDEVERARFVLNMVMPYFTIREEQGGGLQADGKHFLANSKAALQYYFDAHYLDFCNALFLTGEEDMAPIEKGVSGGATQRNASHPLEIFAACNIAAALDGEEFDSNLILAQRTKRELYQWDDLPLNDDSGTYPVGYIRARLSSFARTCFALQSANSLMSTYSRSGSVGDQAWMLNYFPEAKDLDMGQAATFQNMARLFLEWAGELELSAASMSSKASAYRAVWYNAAPLVEGRAEDMSVKLTTIRPDRISEIVQPNNDGERYTFRMLHHDLQRKRHGSMRAGLPGLVCDIYRECGKTFSAFQSADAREGDSNA